MGGRYALFTVVFAAKPVSFDRRCFGVRDDKWLYSDTQVLTAGGRSIFEVVVAVACRGSLLLNYAGCTDSIGPLLRYFGRGWVPYARPKIVAFFRIGFCVYSPRSPRCFCIFYKNLSLPFLKMSFL